VSAFYYASLSKVELEAACQGLSRAFDLPPFEFDCDDSWRYAWSEREGLRVNVTKAQNSRTIETWDPACPAGVNYQLILSAASELPHFQATATELLGAEFIRYGKPADDPAA
jgi:hypothetical protein